MKTLLVAVDFTATSENAVTFAAQWCKKYGYERIILLKTFYASMYENLILSAEYSNVNQDYLNRQRQDDTEILHRLCKRVAAETGPDVKVVTALSELPLLQKQFIVMQGNRC